MLMGLSWLGGLIQIAVDVAFREDKDKNKKDLHEPVSRQFFDQTTQTSPNYSSQGPFSPCFLTHDNLTSTLEFVVTH